jgi:hypothetical protein
MLIIGVVIGAVALSIGGQLWVGRSRPTAAPAAGPPSSSSPDMGSTYDQNGVRFSYPVDWRRGPTSTSGSVGAPPTWTEGFLPHDVTVYDLLRDDVGSLDTSEQEAIVDHLTNSLLGSIQGTQTGAVAPVSIGSEQGYHALMSLTLEGTPIALDFNVLFHGSEEYTIVCQSTSSASAVVAQGCSAIRETFEITG